MGKEKCVEDSLRFVARMMMWHERPSKLHSVEGETFEGPFNLHSVEDKTFEGPSNLHPVEAKTFGNLRVSGSSTSSYRWIHGDQLYVVFQLNI